MTLLRSYPSRAALDRPPSRAVDVVVFLAAAVLLGVIARVSSGIDVPFDETSAPSTVSTDPAQLPYYAARSLLRMFAALGLSVLFTFVYATAAARLRRAEKVMLPILDILQSVPILGFLSVTITGFITLFPGSQLGLEFASIFAIFTSQAWNMTFAFYHCLSTPAPRPRRGRADLRLTHVAAVLAARRAERDDPAGMERDDELRRRLVLSGRLGGDLSVNNHHYALPGIGSYVATAIAAAAISARSLIAIAVMVVMVVGVNVLFWRPLTAWAERFRVEESEAAEAPRSLVLDLLRRSHVPALIGRLFGRLVAPLDRVTAAVRAGRISAATSPGRRRVGDVVFAAFVVAGGGLRACFGSCVYVNATAGFGEFVHALGLGLVTFARVILLVVVATLVWVPVGVWIGMNPKVSRSRNRSCRCSPASRPTSCSRSRPPSWYRTGISLNLGGIVLMSLGAQWYILFNVIAGASLRFPTTCAKPRRSPIGQAGCGGAG